MAPTPDPLPVPAQLEAQLNKCKTVRRMATYYKDRVKTSGVRTPIVGGIDRSMDMFRGVSPRC